MNRIFVMALTIIIASACTANDEQKPPAPAETQPAPEKAPEPPPEPNLLEQLNDLGSLHEVLSRLVPLMKETRDEIDPVGMLLAIWMNSHPNWQELKSIPETKYKLVMKDPVAERGKLLCRRGKIAQIQVDRSVDPPVAIGGIVSGWTDVTRFVAVASSGELVAGKRATICGIVTGLNSYTNVTGGTTHSVQVIGMFDLKANRKLGSEPTQDSEERSANSKGKKKPKANEHSQNSNSQQNTPKPTGFKF